MQWKRTDITDFGSWPLAESLYEKGDPQFIAEVRRITDANLLGDFAARWYGDQRPAARLLLLAYLEQPFNAYRHEALVKRLFKLAEKANDAEVMGRFLVQFDRSVRRRPKSRRLTASEIVATPQEAEARAARSRGGIPGLLHSALDLERRVAAVGAAGLHRLSQLAGQGADR